VSERFPDDWERLLDDWERSRDEPRRRFSVDDPGFDPLPDFGLLPDFDRDRSPDRLPAFESPPERDDDSPVRPPLRPTRASLPDACCGVPDEGARPVPVDALIVPASTASATTLYVVPAIPASQTAAPARRNTPPRRIANRPPPVDPLSTAAMPNALVRKKPMIAIPPPMSVTSN
jgi:hypothetical protein